MSLHEVDLERIEAKIIGANGKRKNWHELSDDVIALLDEVRRLREEAAAAKRR